MTGNEAINNLNFFIDKLHNGIFGDKVECLRVAISAIEQNREYQAIGTVKECREAMERRRATSKQVKRLRLFAEEYNKHPAGGEISGTDQVLLEAADTIEALSAKLQAADCGGGWILCKDRTPEKTGNYIIHTITGTGEDYVGIWLYQQSMHLSGKQNYVDDKQGYWASPYSGDPVSKYMTKNMIAWQPLPDPYHEP